MAEKMTIANLTPDAVAKLQQLEAELGSVVVALQPQMQPAPLTDEQVKRVQQLEAELGVTLLAYKE